MRNGRAFPPVSKEMLQMEPTIGQRQYTVLEEQGGVIFEEEKNLALGHNSKISHFNVAF